MARFKTSLVAAALATVLAAPAFAQSAAIVSPARSADGKPSFDGVWTNASSTRLERSAQYKELIVPKAQADAAAAAAAARTKAANAATDPNSGAPKDGNSTAGYNSYWTDGGDGLMTVRGEARSSFIVEPTDGRIPFKDRAKSLALQIRDGREYQSGKGAYEGPEDLPLRERCLISQSDMGGPVMLSGLYNNFYEFHLTRDHLVIEVEMVHDARIYPIYPTAEKARASHGPSVITPWLGDSVAWWEGDTLVAETTHLNQIQAGRTATPLSVNGVVQERFTRIGDGELLYQFTVTDPAHYSKPWSGEYAFKPAKGRVFEYACHEGNHSIPGILQGARMGEEREAAAAAAKAKAEAAPQPKSGVKKTGLKKN
jgi:hypothetical protein